MSDLSASDVLAMTKSENGMFGGSGITLIVLILFFLTMGNGWFGNNGTQEALTRAEVQDVVTSSAIRNDITNGFQNVNQGMCNGFANQALALNQGFNSVNQNVNTLAAQMASCCCDIKTTLGNKINEVENMINNNTIQDLRDQLNDSKMNGYVTGLTAAQVVQTNNLENFMRALTNGCGCNC